MKRTATSSSSSSLASCGDNVGPPQKIQCVSSNSSSSTSSSASLQPSYVEGSCPPAATANVPLHGAASAAAAPAVAGAAGAAGAAAGPVASPLGAGGAVPPPRGGSSNSKVKGVGPKGGKQLNPARFTDSYALQVNKKL